MKGVLKAIASFFVRVRGRMILSLWDDPAARSVLGRVHALMRQSDHENSIAEARSRYDIQPNVRWDVGTKFGGDGRITVGADTYLGQGCSLVAHPREAKISIGVGCAISHNVHVRTESYPTDMPFAEARKAPGVWADIVVGNDVWIGANVFICGGVTIGSNSVIGANSVVTRDVAANTIVGGAPAHLLREKSTKPVGPGPDA